MKDIKIKRQYAPSDRVFDIVSFFFLALVVVICVYPFWNIFIISINDATDAIRGGIYFLPRKLSLASYKDILTRSTFLHSILVTVLRTAVGTPLAVLATTALAYVLSRQELLWKKPITILFVFTMYFGGGLVPYYMVLKNLNMLNHFVVFIFPNLISVYNMILVRSYIEGMPQELFESSKIDGANDLIIFTRIILPLSKPIIMTIALFVAIMHWNSWFDAYLYTNSQSLKVMQSVLVEILNQYQTAAANQTANRVGQSVTPDSIRMAATMVATIPIIMVYPFIQKYFVKGIMLGAVKS
ncbi:carbohydrate ABC transporter permease [Anaerocolumna xylanovorans]|uniref:Putative aldouronate transport system permease protein n=1 Tax=Anaerocolumna xylanovorans DSM 12503 TaxID=1121345 RepID=A0A1M7Y8G4_9FIRM|nr:carbohydrate ABC transporter permease [Anaerocolumna xylanovorans]SHO48910.1 putative aldouronate transport system permease protein [Anaerocolumna xylanovorans DSM 12503]